MAIICTVTFSLVSLPVRFPPYQIDSPIQILRLCTFPPATTGPTHTTRYWAPPLFIAGAILLYLLFSVCPLKRPCAGVVYGVCIITPGTVLS